MVFSDGPGNQPGIEPEEQIMSEEEAQRKFDDYSDYSKELLQKPELQKVVLGTILFEYYNLVNLDLGTDEDAIERKKEGIDSFQNAIDIFLALLKGETPVQAVRKEKNSNMVHFFRNSSMVFPTFWQEPRPEVVKMFAEQNDWYVSEGMLTQEEAESQKTPSTIQDGINNHYANNFRKLYGDKGVVHADYTGMKRREGTDEKLEKLKQTREMALKRAEEIEEELASEPEQDPPEI